MEARAKPEDARTEQDRRILEQHDDWGRALRERLNVPDEPIETIY